MALTRGSRSEYAHPPGPRASVRDWGRRTLSFSGDLVNRFRARSSTPPRSVSGSSLKPGGTYDITQRSTFPSRRSAMTHARPVSHRERGRVACREHGRRAAPYSAVPRGRVEPAEQRTPTYAHRPQDAYQPPLCHPSRACFSWVSRGRAAGHPAVELGQHDAWVWRRWASAEVGEAVGEERAFA